MIALKLYVRHHWSKPRLDTVRYCLFCDSILTLTYDSHVINWPQRFKSWVPNCKPIEITLCFIPVQLQANLKFCTGDGGSSPDYFEYQPLTLHHYRYRLWYITFLDSTGKIISHGTGHYNDVMKSAMVSQITSLTFVYSAVYSVTDQRKHQSSASLVFVRGAHRRPAGESTAQRDNKAENVSIWWRHHGRSQ